MERTQKIKNVNLWQEVRAQLISLREEAAILLDRGEKEFAVSNCPSESPLESLLLQVKRDQLLSRLGQEAFISLRKKPLRQPRIAKIINDIESIDKIMTTSVKKKTR